MTVKTLKKQLAAAIAMTLVATVALGSSTYAWFVSNNQVTATTTTISALSNAPFLRIGTTSNLAAATTEASRSSESSVALYPAQVVNDSTSPKFQSAYASAATATTERLNTRFDVGTPAAAVTADYALLQTFYIGTNDATAGSFADLKVASVAINDAGTSELDDALSVLVVCDSNWAVYKASNNGAMVATYSDGTTTVSGNNTSGVLASSIEAGQNVQVDCYLFYDGSDTNVYTNNLADLTAVGATITFTATPVTTTGTSQTGYNGN